jgi:signal transduction histidine kinase
LTTARPAPDTDPAPALALLAQLPGQVAVVGPAGEILAVNAGWSRFAAANGLAPPDAAAFNYLAVCEGARGEGTEQARAAAAGIRAVLQREAEAFNLDYPCHSPQEKRWCRLQAVPLGWGGAAAALVLHTDITAIRQARDEVLRLNASLERRVQRRTRQLQSANRELEAFSYSVSHDLKAPLAAVDGFTEALAERLQGRLDEREASYVQRVRAGVANMTTLIDAMLSLHQLARATPLRRTRVDISVLAAEVAAELREALPGRVFDIRIEPGIVLTCDRALMAIALRNLVGNAFKFSARKAVTVLEVAQEWPSPRGMVTLRISDRGAGFGPEQAHRLFVPFQRLHDAADFPGTGVGLATVQRIVQRHGGTVRGEGQVDAGASFWITLPEGFIDTLDSGRED